MLEGTKNTVRGQAVQTAATAFRSMACGWHASVLGRVVNGNDSVLNGAAVQINFGWGRALHGCVLCPDPADVIQHRLARYVEQRGHPFGSFSGRIEAQHFGFPRG